MNKIAVIFWTGTGNTEVMANEVVAGAKEAGADVTLFNTSAFSADKAQEFDKFALGCPAMGAEELEDSEFQPLYDQLKAQISGNFTAQEANKLAEKINAGALPFHLETANYGSVDPSLGENSLVAMGYAGIIAFIVIALIMIIFYRLPGFIAIISLIGQMGLSIAAVSGYFTTIPSFTMTLPGIAGLILSIGMGVDCNVITAERIKEEIKGGRTLDGALDRGTKNSLSAIIDGNMTVVIVSLILMLVFGPANILSIIFGESTTGTIYAFGFTLLVGVISNFIMGIFFSRVMLRSIAGFKPLRKKWLFGGAKND